MASLSVVNAPPTVIWSFTEVVAVDTSKGVDNVYWKIFLPARPEAYPNVYIFVPSSLKIKSLKWLWVVAGLESEPAIVKLSLSL